MFRSIGFFSFWAIGCAVYFCSGPYPAVQLSKADQSSIFGAGICFQTVNTPCDLPENGGVCANLLQLCVNNACPVETGFEKFMDTYRESKPFAAGRSSEQQDYEPLVCIMSRRCDCANYQVGGLTLSVCVRSSDPPNFWGPHIFESYAVGSTCPASGS